MTRGTVVAGVDGSPSSRAAWRWATDEAARRGALLRLVCAYRAPWPFEEFAAGTELGDAALSRAEAVVDETVAGARVARPALVVTGAAVCGGAVAVLTAAAGRADLLVVGSHGHGGFAGLLLGATSLQLATHGPGPVVVVRGREDVDSGPVLVGTDGSADADIALGAALEEAALRGCAVTVVSAYPVPAPPWNHDIEPFVYDPRRLHAAVRATVEDRVARWREKFPGVPVEIVVTPQDPATALIRLSRAARLVVVGTRGHGGFAGLLLGSVGQKLLHHADCPVLIARTTPGG